MSPSTPLRTFSGWLSGALPVIPEFTLSSDEFSCVCRYRFAFPFPFTTRSGVGNGASREAFLLKLP
ncbi:MAG: hypothetical protein P1U85_17780, partial [Verrucomicrobiales bacterium]|nr:hypothetical protein [Verrucomicrobiales bacterium]